MQVHEELQAHGKTLKLFQDTPDAEWEGGVARHRLQLTADFFDHVENLIHAAHQDEQQREGTVHKMALQTLLCCEAHGEAAYAILSTVRL